MKKKMKIRLIINEKAGQISVHEIIEKMKLFFSFFESDFIVTCKIEEVISFVEKAIEESVDAILICGGDGTIHYAIQPLIEAQLKGQQVPKLGIISGGTANDLAIELDLYKKIDDTLKILSSNKEKFVDVISVKSGLQTKYMITNGGIGIPASTAELNNNLKALFSGWREMPFSSMPSSIPPCDVLGVGPSRELLGFLKMSISRQPLFIRQSKSHKISPIRRIFYKFFSEVLKRMGVRLYEYLLAWTLLTWNRKNWAIEISAEISADGSPDRSAESSAMGFQDNSTKLLTFQTSAPYIMVNNQKSIAKNFICAPNTKNNDSFFNIFTLDAENLFKEIKYLLMIKKGIFLNFNSSVSRSFETKKVIFRSLSDRKMTFLADGEILFKDVAELEFSSVPVQISILI